MSDKEFNLLYEPWILTMNHHGKIEELSIIDVFRKAPQLKAIAGELPTQDVAVMRLLLAILHTVIGRYDLDGHLAPLCDGTPDDALDAWADLWEMKRFPMEIIEQYLKKYEDRFWLFHPETPFYQVAALTKDKSVFGPFSVAKLNGELLEGDNKARLFASRSGDTKNSLTYSEAARWLLYILGYSETFGKFEAKAKLEKDAPSIGVGWLGKLGTIMACGKTVFETLMLNLVLLKDGNQVWGAEKPIWEMDANLVKERNHIACPDNPSQLLTCLTRQILLNRDQTKQLVTDYVLLSGTFFEPKNAFSEQFTIWKSKEEKNKPVEFSPKSFDLTKQVWRGFSSIVMQQKSNQKKPGIVSWIGRLKSENILSDRMISFHTSGVEYGTMSAVVADTCHDSICFDAGLLLEKSTAWLERIEGEIIITDNIVYELGRLAQNIEKAAGSDHTDGIRDQVKSEAFYRLDSLFRQWLASITYETDDYDEKCLEWQNIECHLILEMGEKIFASSSKQAFIGRPKSEKETKRPPTSVESYKIFRTKVNEHLLKGGKK